MLELYLGPGLGLTISYCLAPDSAAGAADVNGTICRARSYSV